MNEAAAVYLEIHLGRAIKFLCKGGSLIYSIVVPCFNEADNIGILASEINMVMNQLNEPWECLWIDDKSTDKTWSEIKKLNVPHRGYRLDRNSGQSTAIMAGIDHASFSVIITLDGDLQNNPQDIPNLLKVYSEGNDVVCGYREKRKDKFLRRSLSKIANQISRKVTGVSVSDLGCTLRVFRKELLADSRLFGEMHRVLVVHLVLNGARYAEISVDHRPRIHGESKYGYSRVLKFIADVMLAKSWQVINRKPLYLFSMAALLVAFMASVLAILALTLRITGVKDYIDTSLVSSAVILISTSLILISIGLIAEALLRQNHVLGVTNQYRVLETTEI